MKSKNRHDNFIRKCESLSPRQAEAADLLILDIPFDEIADRMGIGWEQVKGHFQHIRRKMGVRSRVGLALQWAHYRTLVPKWLEEQT